MPAHARYVTHAPVQTTTKDQEQPKRLILKNISHNTELEYTKSKTLSFSDLVNTISVSKTESSGDIVTFCSFCS